MKKYLILILLFMSCSDNPTEFKNILVEATKAFNLEIDTWSADDLRGWSTRGGQLVVFTETERFSQNRSDKYYNVDESLHRGIVLYQVISDTVSVLGYGKGKIVDGFGRRKELIYPGEAYKHISRIDSVWITNDAGIYYANFWYEGDFNLAKQNHKISPSLGKRVE